MNQVEEMSRFAKVMEGIGMFFRELSVNEINSDDNLERLVDEIRKNEDSAKITDLENRTTSCNIPLKDGIVPKAKVSEKRAQEVAKELKAEKTTEKEQKIRE